MIKKNIKDKREKNKTYNTTTQRSWDWTRIKSQNEQVGFQTGFKSLYRRAVQYEHCVADYSRVEGLPLQKPDPLYTSI